MDTLSRDLLAELECPVCFETMLPPIRLCTEGHSLCSRCGSQVNNCPTCRRPLTQGRNITLEKLAEKLNPPSSSQNGESSLEGETVVTDSVNASHVGRPRWIPRTLGRNDLHRSVHCDGCQIDAMQGYRYKCLECADYDLCSTCEGLGHHNTHYMLRMPSPSIQCQMYSRKFSKLLRDSLEKLCERRELNSVAASLLGDVEHPGVTCDVCDNDISGYRYKCLQCHDYDLCATCEGRGEHMEHFVIRIPVPTHWDLRLGSHLQTILNFSAHSLCNDELDCLVRYQNSGLTVSDDNQHDGIKCDGCERRVRGFRYKCLECHDFDLCSVCENSELHEEHYMVRMPEPSHWCKPVGNRVSRYLVQTAFRNCCSSEHTPLQSRYGRRLEVMQEHFGVTCDECQRGIKGFRYKCIQCDNFDLCGICEAKSKHEDHFMIRMPVPTRWCSQYGRRLSIFIREEANQVCFEEGHSHLQGF